MKDKNNITIKVGMIITDGVQDSREFVRRKMKGEVLYVDNDCIVWKPLTEFTKSHLKIEGESTTIKFREILIIEDSINNKGVAVRKNFVSPDRLTVNIGKNAKNYENKT